MTASKGLAVLLAAALFASGLAIGALGVHLFYAQRISRVAAPPMPVGPMFERWLDRRLDLSSSQRREVAKILEQGRNDAESLRRELGPRLREINRSTVAAIGQVLTLEQRVEFEQQMKRWERRQRDFGPGEAPPPPRGPQRR